MSATKLQTSIQSVEIPTADGTCDARFAIPKGDGPFPGVLYYMDAFGLRSVIDDWINRIAAEGYVVLAPNLLYRGSRSPLLEDPEDLISPERRAKLFERLRPMMQALTPENAVRDAKFYLDFLDEAPKKKPGQVGVTGYCMGARIAVRTAAAYPDRVVATAGFHGGNLATDADDSPHREMGKIKGEVYFGHADNDEGMPPEQQSLVDETLAAAGIAHKSECYKDAPHGYTMPDTTAYRLEAAERHFEALIDLLNRKLKS